MSWRGDLHRESEKRRDAEIERYRLGRHDPSGEKEEAERERDRARQSKSERASERMRETERDRE